MKFEVETATGKSRCRMCPRVNEHGSLRRKKIPSGDYAFHLVAEDAGGRVDIYLCRSHAQRLRSMVNDALGDFSEIDTSGEK